MQGRLHTGEYEIGACPRCGGSAKKYTKVYKSGPRKGRSEVKFACKTCMQFYNSRSKTYRRNWNRLKKYGLTPEQFQKMVEEQQGACAICLKKFVEEPCVDEDHKTKQIRGLLCDDCNVGLGRMKDNIPALLKAVEYLQDSTVSRRISGVY